MEACAGSLIHPHRAQSERGSLCPGGGRHCGGLSGPIAAREANRTPSGCDAGTPACPGPSPHLGPGAPRKPKSTGKQALSRPARAGLGRQHPAGSSPAGLARARPGCGTELGRSGEGEVGREREGAEGPGPRSWHTGALTAPAGPAPPPTRTAISWGRGPLSEEGAGTRKVKCGGGSHLSTYCVPGTSRILGPAPDGGGGRGGAGPAPTAASRGLAAGLSPVRAPCPLPGQPVCAPEGVGPGWEGRLESVLCAKQRSPGRAGQGT